MRRPLLAALTSFATACGAAPGPLADPAALPAPAPVVAETFPAVLAALAAHDAAGDWTDTACDDLARRLLASGAESPALARYDAGLVQQRCGRGPQAIAFFQSAVAADPGLAPARVALAVAEAAAAKDRGDLAAAERRLGEALLQDETSARLLAQLAIVHLAAAERAPARLDLARAVAERAVAVEPGSAPAHHAAGLVATALREYARALASFDRARRLDPRFFEAHVHAADLRLRTGDHAGAADAYRAALRVQPASFDARLGLARALRRGIDAGDEAGWDARVDAARRETDALLAHHPERPEGYLVAGILALHHEGRRETTDLGRAERLFRAFLARSASTPAFARQRALAEAWLADIDDAVNCRFGQSERERKERERERIREAAEEEIRALSSP